MSEDTKEIKEEKLEQVAGGEMPHHNIGDALQGRIVGVAINNAHVLYETPSPRHDPT